MPFYLKEVGAEGYGLIAFYLMIQAIFFILDLGMSQTISRHTSLFRGGGISKLEFLKTFTIVEFIFLIIAILSGLIIYNYSLEISNEWIKSKNIAINDIENCMKIVSFIIVFRWAEGVYRGVISGSEEMIWLGCFNIVFMSLKYIGVLPILYYANDNIIAYFQYQLLVVILEFILLRYKTLKIIPSAKFKNIVASKIDFRVLMKFAGSIGVTSVIWSLVTQMDKLLLSKYTVLEDFGVFSLAVTAAAGIVVVTSPITSAIAPRMVMLESQSSQKELIDLYRKATQLVMLIVGSATLVLAFESSNVLLIWTGNPKIASEAAPILTLYALGNGLLAIGGFPYSLQYAKGNLRLHLIGNVIFLLLYMPILFFGIINYKAVGAAFSWLGINILFLFVWAPIVHKKLNMNINIKWFIVDIIPILFLMLVAILSYRYLVIFDKNNILIEILNLILMSCITLIVGLMGATLIRKEIKKIVFVLMGKLSNKIS